MANMIKKEGSTLDLQLSGVPRAPALIIVDLIVAG